MRSGSPCSGLLAVVLLIGCSTGKEPPSWSTRHGSTGIEEGEKIAIILTSFTRPDGQQNVYRDAERRMQDCVNDGFRAVNRRSMLVAPGSMAARYAVDVKVNTLNSEQRGESFIRFSGVGVGNSWSKSTWFEGQVFDLKHHRSAGGVTARADGEESSGFVLVLFVIPIPIVSRAQTEQEACQYFGHELARFITDPNRGALVPK
jgi:hypothetical protein